MIHAHPAVAGSRRFRLFLALATLVLAPFARSNTPPPLPLARVFQLPMTWPEKVAAKESFSDGKTNVTPGMLLNLHDVQRTGVVVSIPGNKALFMVDASWTDLGERAAKTLQELPEDARALTTQDIIRRTDLLPDFITLTSDVTVADGRVLPVGTRMIPGRLQQNGGSMGIVLVERDVQFNQHGGLNRHIFNTEFTDVIARMRERARQAPAERKLRANASLAGKLVNATGEPLPAGGEPVRYQVIYYAADWCGWCKRFTPTLVKFHEEMKAQHPEVQIVYLSSDRSPEEMAKNYKSAEMPWPAVDFAKRKEVMGLLTMAGPSTPHVLVLAADGRIVHDGQPGGANGANAALAALRRELAASKRL